jgi:hypothetical protein
MNTRARIGAAVATAVATATLLVTTGSASAHDGSGRSEAHGSSPIADFDWHVSRDSNGRPHGYFKGKAPYGADILIFLEGPATCVDIEGNQVGFLYPVEDNSRPFILKGQSILITGVDNGGQGRDRMGFSPIGFFNDCHPSIAPLPVTSGHIKVEDH